MSSFKVPRSPVHTLALIGPIGSASYITLCIVRPPCQKVGIRSCSVMVMASAPRSRFASVFSAKLPDTNGNRRRFVSDERTFILRRVAACLQTHLPLLTMLSSMTRGTSQSKAPRFHHNDGEDGILGFEKADEMTAESESPSWNPQGERASSWGSIRVLKHPPAVGVPVSDLVW